MSRISLLLLTLLVLAGAACADGMLVPVRPEVPRFSVAYHKVNVTIDHQVATTDIDQAFHNESSRQVEGTYIFPIADGVTISKFTMYVNNEPLEYKTLEKEEARRIYNGIVSKRQDPALLEWLGTRMIQARVFPIEPNENKRIRIAYQEVLKAQGGVIKYVYPLKTEKISAKNLPECSVDVTIRSAQPIRSVYSPTHSITVEREGDRIAKVSYKEKNVLPDQDLVLYYTVSEQDLGLDLLTYKDGDKDGYFLMLVAPKADIKEDEVQAKDVIFVLDKSGSMATDDKISQARAALKFCLNSLGKHDRFNLIAFNEDVRRWETGMQYATRENIRSAEAFVNDIKADGGTNINGALNSALELFRNKPDDFVPQPNIIIFLTDGLPTVGETNVEKILANVKAKNTALNTRIFDFGVGTDYNAHFLDKLALQNHGFAENVLPKEDIEVKVSAFYKQVSAPLLMNVTADWGDADVYDIYPKEMPDVFKGSQLIVAGRYKLRGGAVATKVRLTGEMNGKKQTFTYPVKFPTSAMDDDFIPRLWATRKIGYLEDQARLNGASKELMEEIIRLSKEFGILTEYTSFLVDADTTIAVRPGEALPPMIMSKGLEANASFGAGKVADMAREQAGASGVSQSYNRKANMNAAQAAPGAGSYVMNEAGQRVQLSQLRNISQRSFVQSGTQWMDVNFQQNMRVVKVKAFSPAYFQLANAHPRMAQFFSQGGNVTVALRNVAIQTGPDGQEAEFKPAEFTDIQKEIDTELGEPVVKAAGALPVAMIPPARSPLSLAWALLPALPVGALLLRRCREKRG
ncbi:MAG: VIT and vWA domain-containing protein [Armatimonadota bacterium]